MSEVASTRASALLASSRFSDAVSLAKPGITLLIVLVAVGGYFLANPTAVDWYRLLLLVLTGAAASAGAAMLNHYLDRDVDPQMHRTSDRPLAAERIASSTAVLIAGLAFLAVGIGVASALLNPLTGFSIFLGGFTYVVVYTAWLKRRSSWNIVIGGFAGSAPALAGSAAAIGYWSTGSIAFAILVFLWTPPHFWSLALLLKDDYARAGLPMLPRMNDPAYSGKVVVISAALLVPAALLIGWTGAITWPILVVLVVLGLLFVMFTLPLWKRVDRATARRGFIYSGPYLLFVILALIVNVPLLRFGIPTGFG
ncbi:Protohem IX farnesyltransferase [mine drainage metagenome]|uniref:Protohem IX farnesyltransferase n=1 Tax=mine drainage metagenome TaxID=410659 RepID=T1BV60_9ZZZZ